MNNPFESINARLGNIETLLLDLKHATAKQTDNDVSWLDINQLCSYHPEKPARATVYTWVRERRIPFHKKGKKLIFLRSEIDEWLKQGRCKTIDEIHHEAETYLRSPKQRKSVES